jgi:hypothetical protein|uniref:Uncharacterized protein n=1 Tax=viral metagenome TaxID=1070528 RepID=A0A6C0J1L8_9ZZZZ
MCETNYTCLPKLNNNDWTYKSGETYYINIMGLNHSDQDAIYEKIYEDFVYNPSIFNITMEKLFYEWVNGTKVNVLNYEVDEITEYNRWSITIEWEDLPINKKRKLHI